jgi:hypothetical protein
LFDAPPPGQYLDALPELRNGVAMAMTDLESLIWEFDRDAPPIVVENDSSRIKKEWLAAMTPQARARLLWFRLLSRRGQRRVLASGKMMVGRAERRTA